MKIYSIIVLCLLSVVTYSQVKTTEDKDSKDLQKARIEKANAVRTPIQTTNEDALLSNKSNKPPIAKIEQYKIITMERDTIIVDTSLTIHKEYAFNYLRKDIFGLLPFANEGQTYNTLDFGLTSFSPNPEIGFRSKQFNFLKAEQINYYHVATPLTELYFKTVMEQGQNLDAFITLNTSERLNYSIAYKGLRSLGKYQNQLSSTGNFRFTTSYNTANNKYFLKAHITAQDILNGENGGIIDNSNFENGEVQYKTRARIPVYLTDAQSLFKGNRYFVDHQFKLNNKEAKNQLFIKHQINFEHMFFEYKQPTVASTITSTTGTTTLNRFGNSYVLENINDKTRYNKMYNKVGVMYATNTIGDLTFFVDDYNFNYYYNRVIINQNQTIPSSLNDRINTVGGMYNYQKNKWKASFLYASSISDHDISNFDAKVNYRLTNENHFELRLQNLNKVANNNFNLFQSSYINYNWSNSFKNEKITNMEATAHTKWLNFSLQATTLNDHLYLSNNDTSGAQLLVTPKQYGTTINYVSFKASKEFKFWKLALDNTLLYQQVDQNDAIVNVPKLVTRNSLYYSDNLFNKALFLQTGFTVNYFSKYYANDYNPVMGEFYIQNKSEIGDFPMVDFFVNARIKQTRIFFKAEHFNAAMTGFDYYSAPNYPYRDFIIRFGMVWNFFQ